VFHRRELHDELPLLPTEVDLDRGVEPVRETVRPFLCLRGCGRTCGRTSRLRTPFDIVPALLQSNDLLQRPDRQPLVDDPLRQAILEVAVLQRKQCPRVPRTQYPRRYARLLLGWEVEQPQCVGDVRTRT